MTDLRSLANALADHGDIVTPPLEAVARRARRTRTRRAGRAVALVVVAGLLAPTVVDWVTDGDRSSHVRMVDDDTSRVEPPTVDVQALGSVATGPVLPTPTTTTTTAKPPPPVPSITASVPRPDCRNGSNDGATDRGVTATSIRVVMTETLDLSTRYTTVEASVPVRKLFNEVNRQGGICGRLIDFHLANAVWGPLPWYPEADVFASIAGPHDPAVDDHLLNGTTDRLAMPLVGTDGRIAAHHRARWTWPTGLTTGALTRIAVADAYRTGARSFAFVYDADEAIGREAAHAFEAYVGGLSGVEKTHVQGLRPKDDFGIEAAEFNASCVLVLCDSVILAMPPQTAFRWLEATPTDPMRPTTIVPAQLSAAFWNQCTAKLSGRCNNLRVWGTTGSAPGPLGTGPSSTCNHMDAPGEGLSVLLSACALVEALRQLGPNPTRDRLRHAMDDLTYRMGLVAPFVDGRRVADDRAGPRRARALKPVYTSDGGSIRFARMESASSNTDVRWVEDPAPERN